MLTKVYAVVICAPLFFSGCNVEPIAEFPPIDEATADASLIEFRELVRNAIAERDGAFIAAALAPDAAIDPEYSHSPEAFREDLTGRYGAPDKFWDDISVALENGGQFADDSTFVAPYVYTAWPDSINPANCFAVRGPVPVSKSYVKRNSDTLTIRDCIVKRLPGQEWDANPVQVSFGVSDTGYVDRKALLSPFGLRVGMRKTDGNWSVKFLASGVTPPGPELKMLPVDDSDDDSSFAAFKSELKTAVAARDTAFLFSTTDPEIHFSFGYDAGIQQFKEYWHFERGEQCEFWNKFGRVLEMGGAFDSTYNEPCTNFVAPYVFALWDQLPISCDSYFYAVVGAENVSVFSAPDSMSTSIAKLSYSVVGTKFHNKNWYEITTPDNRLGYVQSYNIASPIGYRASFVKTDGKWLMTYFIAGD